MNKTIAQYLIVGTIIILFMAVVSSFLQPLILGFLLALVAYPAHLKIKKLIKGQEALAALITTLLMVIGLILPLTLISILVFEDALSFFTRDFAESALSFNLPAWLDLPPAIAKLIPKSKELLVSVAGKAGTTIAEFASSIPFFLIQLVIYIISFFYACYEGEKLGNFIMSCLPFSKKEIQKLSSTTEAIGRAVVLGSFLAAFTQGFLMWIAFLSFNIPKSHMFGFLTFIFAFIPVLGAGAVGGGGAIYLWSIGSTGPAIGVLIFTVIASIADSVIKPWVLKGKSSLHPLLGLVSALGGIIFFGGSGIIFGPLLAALLVVILDLLRSGQLVERS